MSVHLVTAALDDGPLLARLKLAVAPNDTETSWSNRVLALEHQLYPAVITALAEGFVHVKARRQMVRCKPSVSSITGGAVCFPRFRLRVTLHSKNNSEDLDLTIKQRHNKQHIVSQPVGGKEHEYR